MFGHAQSMFGSFRTQASRTDSVEDAIAYAALFGEGGPDARRQSEMTTINLVRHRPGHAAEGWTWRRKNAVFCSAWWTVRGRMIRGPWRKFWEARSGPQVGEFINFEVFFPRLGPNLGGT